MSTNHELSELLRAERAVLPPSAAVEQGFRRLALDLAANAAPLPVAVGPLKLGIGLVPKWIVAGFTVGLLGTGVVAPRLAPSPGAAPNVSSRVLSVAAPNRGSLVADPPVPAERRQEPELASSSGALAPRAPMASVSVSASRPATFDAEFELISRAKAELDAHRLQAALARLSEHAERFPNGVFAVERDALRILARCEEAPHEALAQQFAKQHPGSPLWQRLDRACRAGATATPLRPEPSPKSTLDFSKLPNGPTGAGERTDDLHAGERR